MIFNVTILSAKSDNVVVILQTANNLFINLNNAQRALERRSLIIRNFTHLHNVNTTDNNRTL